jgi:hypothetical protein
MTKLQSMRITHIISLITLIVNFSFIFSSCSIFSPTELITSSPDKVYKVHLMEMEESGTDYQVKFSVEKQGRMLIEDKIFHSDSGKFISSGLKTNWLSNNVLALRYLDSSEKPDEISVENQTDKVIRYLKITARDRFLILELQAHSKTQLSAYPQTDKTADISWIGGVGMYDDGQMLPAWGMNFRIRGKYISPAHYCVLIKENEVLVQSKDFEGFLDKIEVPEAKNSSCQ